MKLQLTLLQFFQTITTMKQIDAPCYVVHCIPSFETKRYACPDNITRDNILFYQLFGKNAKKLDANHWAYVDEHGEVCSISILPL